MASSTTPSPSNEHQSFPKHLSKINVSNFVSAKLWRDKQSNNYYSWKKQMLCLIESQDLLCFIDGKIEPPQRPPETAADDGKKNNKNYVIWRTDRLIQGWILGALDEALLKTVAKNVSTARDVWVELENIFSERNDQVHQEWNDYLPFYRATIARDWRAAKQILEKDPDAMKAGLNSNLETALHIAVARFDNDFVRELVDLMPNDLLGQTDKLGHTALHVAARKGRMGAAKILVDRRPDLLYNINNVGELPVHMAALSSNDGTFRYFVNETKGGISPSLYRGEMGVKLLCSAIDAEFFDVALDLAKMYPNLAILKLEDGNSALKRIALKKSTFDDSGDFSSTPRSDVIRLKERRRKEALDILECLCENIKTLAYWNASAIYEDALLTAARSGLHEVIRMVCVSFPEAIYSQDPYTRQSIIHIAAENHDREFFKVLSLQYGRINDQISNMKDSFGNTLLHLAAKLAPLHKLNLITGAALQMQSEIQWFEEMQDFVHPSLREEVNNAGKTPRMVFTEEHVALRAEGEKWIKETTNACSIVAALVATITFAAAITVPGGNESYTGFPLFSKKSGFQAFTVLNAISFFASIISLFQSLSLISSCYAENEFKYSLPKRLMLNLVALFTSAIAMWGAFTAIICLLVGHRNQLWVLPPMLLLAVYPAVIFLELAGPLFRDVIFDLLRRLASRLIGLFSWHKIIKRCFSYEN